MKRILTTIFFLGILALSHSQVVVTRGPYIQLATQTSIRIKWRTNVATTSRVIYGLSQASQTSAIQQTANVTEHEIEITGLNPDTKYFYSIGNLTDLISASPVQYFYTLPPTNTSGEYNFWVLGDCGSANNDQRTVRNSYQSYIGNNRVYGMIMLGDNAYTFGTDGDYQDAIFNNMYEDIIANTVMWPTPGNHDYYSGADASTQTGPYYDIFSLPKNAQLGGVPSNTEAYYSYNIGNIHFISIDSYDSGRDSNNAMGNWIKQDLLNNTQEWTIAYFHHAPYTKGNHNSDNPFPYLDFELVEMRQQIVPLLERGGVDLILCGHSHTYERSYLLKGHYGNSSSLNFTNILDNGSGDWVTDCPYVKNTEVSEAYKGTVYTVLGVSGKKDSPGSGWPHPAMHTATTDHLGSMMLTVKDNRLDAKFITSNNTVYDKFTIVKNAGGKQTVHVCQGEEVELSPSFPTTQYTWMPGNLNQPVLTVQPFFSSYYFGSDPMGCIKDTFQLSVIQPGSPNDTCNLGVGLPENSEVFASIGPNPVQIGAYIDIQLNKGENVLVDWIDLSGRTTHQSILNPGINHIWVDNKMSPGVYTLHFHFKNSTNIFKIILTS